MKFCPILWERSEKPKFYRHKEKIKNSTERGTKMKWNYNRIKLNATRKITNAGSIIIKKLKCDQCIVYELGTTLKNMMNWFFRIDTYIKRKVDNFFWYLLNTVKKIIEVHEWNTTNIKKAIDMNFT